MLGNGEVGDKYIGVGVGKLDARSAVRIKLHEIHAHPSRRNQGGLSNLRKWGSIPTTLPIGPDY